MKKTLSIMALFMLVFSACEVTTKTSTTVTTPAGEITKTETKTEDTNGTNVVTEIKEENNLTATTDTLPPNNTEEIPSSFTGNIKQLMAKNLPIHCQAELNEAGNLAKLDFYFDQKTERYRYNITNTSPQITFNSYIITDKDYSYMWNDQETMGTKIKELADEDNSEMSGEEDLADKDMAYKCEKWSVDEQLLTIPNNITFQEITMPSLPDFSDEEMPLPPLD